MIKLDSIKIEFDRSAINSISNGFLEQKNSISGKLVTDKQSMLKSNLNGLKSIMIDNLNETTHLEMSAKILGSKYFEGINQNTVVEALHNVNKSGAIDLNIVNVLDTAQILRCDITDNIKPDITDKDLFYGTLASLPINKKYHVDRYQTKNNQGVVWHGTQKTVRDRIIFYNKQKDILRDKILRQQPYANNLYKQFDNVVRVESNHSKFKDLNKLFGTRKLNDALLSDKKVNHDIFARITNKTNDIDLRLFQYFEGMKFNEIVKFLGHKGIIELCNYDWSTIDLFLRNHNKHNYRHYRTKIRNTYNTLMQDRTKYDTTIIKHIKDLLYAS